MRGLSLIGVLISLVASAATGIFIFLVGEFGDTQRNLLLTTLAIGVFSLAGLASTVGAGTWWLWLVRPLGLATSLVGLGMVLLLIWGVADDNQRNLKLAATLGVMAFSSAHLSLLGSFRPANLWVWLWRSGTILAALGLAYLVIGGLWGRVQPDAEEFYLRWVGVVAILDVLGTIGLFPLSRLAGTPKAAAPRGRRLSRRRLSPSS